jgi:[acyl-carrier-protein] S-malonyltransferase
MMLRSRAVAIFGCHSNNYATNALTNCKLKSNASDTSEIIGLMFPGQGSQQVGMGVDLYSNPFGKDVFDQVDEALGEKLSELMFRGDPLELQKTSNAQPAILAHSMAILAVAESILPKKFLQQTQLFMGHSLGEFTAACAAGCLTLPDAVRLVRARGKTMEEAAAKNLENVSMVAMMPLGLEKAFELCSAVEWDDSVEDGGVCQVANWNAENQVVLSGTKCAVECAVALGKTDFKVRRAVPLNVSAPFHCTLMTPAEQTIEKLLPLDLPNPTAPIVMNIDGSARETWPEIRQGLVDQTCSTVMWVTCAKTAVEGLTNLESENDNTSVTMYELGPGSTLSSLMRRTAPKHWTVTSLATAENVEQLLKTSDS